jgi:predicted DsbA family dithiol-disulfide isomerase
LEKLKTTHDVVIRWHSFELRPAGTPPIPEHILQRIMAGRPQFERTAREQHGIEINSGEFGINTHKAHVATQYAKYEGKGVEYHDALLRAYWLEARDISNSETLVEIGVTVGLNADEVQRALQDKTLDALVNSDINQAHTLGLNGVPALIFEQKYLVSGAQPYAVLADVVEQLQNREG